MYRMTFIHQEMEWALDFWMGFDLIKYHINPKYSDRYTEANSVDSDQMLENEVDTVCNSPSNLDTTRDSKIIEVYCKDKR